MENEYYSNEELDKDLKELENDVELLKKYDELLKKCKEESKWVNKKF